MVGVFYMGAEGWRAARREPAVVHEANLRPSNTAGSRRAARQEGSVHRSRVIGYTQPRPPESPRMSLPLFRKLLHDLRWPLLFVVIFLAGFETFWAKFTERIAVEIVPALAKLGPLEKIANIFFS